MGGAAGLPAVGVVVPGDVAAAEGDGAEALGGSVPRAAPPFPADGAAGDEGGVVPGEHFADVKMALEDEDKVVVGEEVEGLQVVDDAPVGRNGLVEPGGGLEEGGHEGHVGKDDDRGMGIDAGKGVGHPLALGLADPATVAEVIAGGVDAVEKEEAAATGLEGPPRLFEVEVVEEVSSGIGGRGGTVGRLNPDKVVVAEDGVGLGVDGPVHLHVGLPAGSDGLGGGLETVGDAVAAAEDEVGRLGVDGLSGEVHGLGSVPFDPGVDVGEEGEAEVSGSGGKGPGAVKGPAGGEPGGSGGGEAQEVAAGQRGVAGRVHGARRRRVRRRSQTMRTIRRRLAPSWACMRVNPVKTVLLTGLR